MVLCQLHVTTQLFVYFFNLATKNENRAETSWSNHLVATAVTGQLAAGAEVPNTTPLDSACFRPFPWIPVRQTLRVAQEFAESRAFFGNTTEIQKF